MARKQENIVRVLDPDGQIFEVTQRNAQDLVQHNGWTFEDTRDNKATFAAAPRTPRPRGEKLKEAQILAEKDAERASALAEKIRAGELPPETTLDDVEPTHDEQAEADLGDELAALEKEEDDEEAAFLERDHD